MHNIPEHKEEILSKISLENCLSFSPSAGKLGLKLFLNYIP